MPSEEKTWGAGLIGLVVAVMYIYHDCLQDPAFSAQAMHLRLYGITNVQTYYYALNYKHDPSLTKLMVAVLWYENLSQTIVRILNVQPGFWIPRTQLS